MEYSKLISVTGLPGLFELVASKNDGAIVRSLDDKTTKFVSSRIHNFSHLESIEVYTEGDNVNLADVFLAMKSSGEALPDEKEAPAVKKYFEKVYPTMDFGRVYASDMKKMIKWFDVLTKNNIEIKVSEETPEGEEETPDPDKQPEEKPKAEEPVATPAAEAKPKRAKAKKEEAVAEVEPEAAKKKAVRK
ncbi:DUF5606 domain-containing protein [Parafilimonas sp.]|uniref:DUF5606 family protein n=1 Tax=Parafilimonas sp. TaxID=1969739 RepID=UPI0039E61498